VPTVDVSAVIDRQPLGRLQYTVFLLCWANLFVEGFDTQAVAYVAPSLGHAWNLSRGALGTALSAGLLGLTIGSILIAPLADRAGRRPVIVLSTLLFGAMTLLTPLATSVRGLIAWRLLTGLGLGGAMPNVISLAAEYSPERKRAAAVMYVFTGFPVGSACGGVTAARLIPVHGWQSVFICGGVLSLLLFVALSMALPESLRLLALIKPGDRRLALISKIDKAIDPELPLTRASDQQIVAKGALRELFYGGRAAVTPLLWTIYFMSLLNLYLLASWLPAAITSFGASIESAAVATSLFHIGGIVGGAFLGIAAHRFGTFRIMPAAQFVAAASVGCLALVGSSVALTMVAVFVAGVTVIGCVNCNHALASILYPTGLRATGVGWANAVGRVGSMTGPVFASVILSRDPDIGHVFFLAVLPAVCAGIATAVIARNKAGANLAGAEFGTAPHVNPDNPAVGRANRLGTDVRH
jgi:MFS transporter, AAHS family, 4-hydroxybenzoate transporter